MMHPKLYKCDSNGSVRVWWMETDGNAYRTHSGVEGGAVVTSGWKYADAKNVGRANSTTPEQQALKIVQSQYTNRLSKSKYRYSLDDELTNDFFQPMLAEKYTDAVKKGWIKFPVLAQPKLDGIRCIARAAGLWTRGGKPITSCRHIEEQLRPFFEVHPWMVLDGELYNHDLRDDFEQIVSLVRKQNPAETRRAEIESIVQFHVYDAYDHKQPHLDWWSRVQLAVDYIGLSGLGPIRFVETAVNVEDQERLDGLYGMWMEDGYEGQMIRDSSAAYENRRSRSLLKRKEFEDAEFRVVRVEEGVGNYSGYAKSVIIDLGDGRTQSSGMRGRQAWLAEVLRERDDYVGGTAMVRYQNLTGDRKLRFPVVIMLYKGERDL